MSPRPTGELPSAAPTGPGQAGSGTRSCRGTAPGVLCQGSALGGGGLGFRRPVDLPHNGCGFCRSFCHLSPGGGGTEPGASWVGSRGRCSRPRRRLGALLASPCRSPRGAQQGHGRCVGPRLAPTPCLACPPAPVPPSQGLKHPGPHSPSPPALPQIRCKLMSLLLPRSPAGAWPSLLGAACMPSASLARKELSPSLI